MGNCCGTGNVYPEIDEASCIKDIIEFLQDKQNEIPKEIKELEDYLEDKSKIPKRVDVAHKSDLDINKRIDYLKSYVCVLGESIEKLKDKPDADLDITKNIILDLYSYYFLVSDPSMSCKKSLDRLDEIPNNNLN